MNDLTPPSPVILFVDDEAHAVKYFQRAISELAPVITASSVEEGMHLLDMHADTLAVLVSDQRMPGKYGNELLRYARDRYPHMVRILTTAYSELEHTVDAINQGQIHRYIKKPWEIGALRLELKQILEFANLRKERDHLVREKLVVRQKQIVANRIGTLNVLCASLLGSEHTAPLTIYLASARTAGVKAPKPDWFLMDYSDLVSAEALRSGAFGYALRNRLNYLQQHYQNYSGQRAWVVLAEILPDKVEQRHDAMVLLDERMLTEFLETSSYAIVSQQHASWLAFLIWLTGLGWSLQTVRTENVLYAHLIPRSEMHTATNLASWIEQF